MTCATATRSGIDPFDGRYRPVMYPATLFWICGTTVSCATTRTDP